ncbi:MAG: DUF1611 domain-containing protein [Gammaproteobacteria bacterium]|nr:DUF1611 domain-containing protein [Gammaproteobacteria bacterium]
MLNEKQKIAVFMEGNIDSDYGKMGYGVMRYARNPVVCVIDSANAGKRVCDACDLPFEYPVAAGMREAAKMGAEAVVIGIAPSGGRVAPEWEEAFAECARLGMSLVNGLHDPLSERLKHLLQPGRWIWDVRQPAFTPPIAAARAAALPNKRALLVGTDMAIGKMTAGLEIHRWLRAQGKDAVFLATGQVGITITGRGIPLDAFKLDHACGAVEKMVLEAGGHDIAIIEGQGSLLHPGSSATLSLMRGSCATHLIMCHRVRMTRLRAPNSVAIPPLADFIRLNEEVAAACGSLTRAAVVGVALNTAALNEDEARAEIKKTEDETGLPAEDVVRFGAGKLGKLLA